MTSSFGLHANKILAITFERIILLPIDPKCYLLLRSIVLMIFILKHRYIMYLNFAEHIKTYAGMLEFCNRSELMLEHNYLTCVYNLEAGITASYLFLELSSFYLLT